jgi:putative tricarboxylic transport membrane protein
LGTKLDRGTVVLKGTEFWGGLFWLLLGVFVAKQGLNLGHGPINEPGSGFALIWIGVLMAGLALIVLASAFKDPGASLASLWSGTRWGKVLAVVVLLLAVGYFFETLGFIVCGSLLLLILMTAIDPVGLARAVPIALLVPASAWWIITKGLKIQMPTGVLAPWLG